jgi:hypothetical protein
MALCRCLKLNKKATKVQQAALVVQRVALRRQFGTEASQHVEEHLLGIK